MSKCGKEEKLEVGNWRELQESKNVKYRSVSPNFNSKLFSD